MEQYSEMQKYSLWEDMDYYGMPSDPDQVPADNHGKNFPISTHDDNHVNARPDAARKMYHVVSSPEAANPAKGKRRRSKGAAPTTFLNASISNFRAVVQQHTGCHNADSSPKGPITLCFAAPSPHTNKLYY